MGSCIAAVHVSPHPQPIASRSNPGESSLTGTTRRVAWVNLSAQTLRPFKPRIGFVLTLDRSPGLCLQTGKRCADKWTGHQDRYFLITVPPPTFSNLARCVSRLASSAIIFWREQWHPFGFVRIVLSSDIRNGTQIRSRHTVFHPCRQKPSPSRVMIPLLNRRSVIQNVCAPASSLRLPSCALRSVRPFLQRSDAHNQFQPSVNWHLKRLQ